MVRVFLSAVASLLLTATLTMAQPPTPTSPDEFVPLSQLPPGQELPAAPFLVGSYAFFLALMIYYLWTIWRRIGKVESELRALEHRGVPQSRAQ